MTDVPNLAIEELNKRVKNSSQVAVAEELDISTQYLNDILHGRRNLSDNILDKLGFEKVVIHVKKQDANRLLRAIEPTITTMRGVERLEKTLRASRS